LPELVQCAPAVLEFRVFIAYIISATVLYSITLWHVSKLVILCILHPQLTLYSKKTGKHYEASSVGQVGDAGALCTVEMGCKHTHNEIIVQIPPGAGRNLEIVINLGLGSYYQEGSCLLCALCVYLVHIIYVLLLKYPC
jgi:hypothetical protein